MTSKKDQILTVAYHLLAEGNYQSMTTSKIAQAAGVAEGTLYRYFSNKRHLLVEVMVNYSNILVDKIFSTIDNTKSVHDNLQSFGENFYQSLQEDSAFYRFMLKVHSELDSEDLRSEIQNYYYRYLGRIKDVFIWAKNNHEITMPDKEIDLLVKTIWSVGEGIIKHSVMFNIQVIPKDERKYTLGLIETALAGGIL